MDDRSDDTAQDQELLPTTDTTSLNSRQEPGAIGETIPVPQDLVDAGHDTNEPQADSSESLDTEDDQHLQEGESSIKPLSEDNASPFSEPNSPIADSTADVDVRQDDLKLDDTHQATDSATNIDSHQTYDEGLAGAAEASEPNAGNTVVDYDPEKDQRNANAASS